MKVSTEAILNDLILRYPKLESIKEQLISSVDAMIRTYAGKGKMLICGNGGSAADALHIVGELMKGFILPRPLPEDMQQKIATAGEYGEYINNNLQSTLPAIALVGSAALESAYANDRAPDLAFAQQVYGYGSKGDIFLGISTSGNSKNVIYAAEVAKAKDLIVISLTGATGGKLKERTDYLINVPETETYMIQELHLPVYHAICLALENEFFGE